MAANELSLCPSYSNFSPGGQSTPSRNLTWIKMPVRYTDFHQPNNFSIQLSGTSKDVTVKLCKCCTRSVKNAVEKISETSKSEGKNENATSENANLKQNSENAWTKTKLKEIKPTKVMRDKTNVLEGKTNNNNQEDANKNQQAAKRKVVKPSKRVAEKAKKATIKDENNATSNNPLSSNNNYEEKAQYRYYLRSRKVKFT